MFDRKKQPVWLKLVNLFAVIALGLIVFVPAMFSIVWLTTFFVCVLIIAAVLNFLIQFRDVLSPGKTNPSKEMVMEMEDADESEGDDAERKYPSGPARPMG